MCHTASAHAPLLNDGGFEAATAGSFIYTGSSIEGGSWNVISGAVYIDLGDSYVGFGNNSPNLTGINPDVPNTTAAVSSTISGDTDQGADPNKFFVITDRLTNNSPAIAAQETFADLRDATSAQVLRGVSFTPGTAVASFCPQSNQPGAPPWQPHRQGWGFSLQPYHDTPRVKPDTMHPARINPSHFRTLSGSRLPSL